MSDEHQQFSTLPKEFEMMPHIIVALMGMLRSKETVIPLQDLIAAQGTRVRCMQDVATGDLRIILMPKPKVVNVEGIRRVH